MDKTSYKSGFVSIIGRPNVGKSTLMNHVIGQKVAIMSDKPQTTRNKIQGVYTTDREQMIFIDTPGVHKPQSKLGDLMVEAAVKTLNEVDLILFLVDAKAGYGKGDQFIIDRFQSIKTPVFLVINKIDQVHPDELLPLIDHYRKLHDFAEVVPVSALHGNNVRTLLQQIAAYLPEGPQYYPHDQVTDHPEQFIVAELIREKALQLTKEEIPHSVAVVVEEMKVRQNERVYIYAILYVERDSQKKIVIGKNGSMLKEIGQRARKDIEALLGNPVFLDLWVKVKQDWRNEERWLHSFGYRKE